MTQLRHMLHPRLRFLATVSLLLATLATQAQSPAQFKITGNEISMSRDGHPLFSGTISGSKGPFRVQDRQETIDGALHQVITITGGDFNAFNLTGIINAGKDAIACESEPKDKGIKFVRHSVGQSFSLRNNAIYERQGDWLLSFDAGNPKVRIVPKSDREYDVNVRGWEIVIRFRPAYYRQHRGITRFQPDKYEVWKAPVQGWCSWFAYLDKVREEDIRSVADVLQEKLVPYGLDYLQIDDGYQQVPIGLPDTWLKANAKFPSGMASTASYIRSKGMTPGIWTNVSFADSAAAWRNKSLFVKDAAGGPAQGNWVGYVMDGSNPKAIRELITPVYKGLREQGWSYFKLDALRHLKYEGYNSYADYFKASGYDRNTAFRNVVQEVRDQVGKNNFLLACWGIRPELVGLVDGCRIGNDGYSYAGLAQFNSWNNIIWRIDPDHIELSDKEAYRSCTATSITGSVYMLTDKAELYRSSPLIEAARRTLPVLFTRPGQVYDVDPSVSSKFALADIELSGSGPRPFDASSSTTTDLFALEINKPWENWTVLARLDEREKMLSLPELGLEAGTDYLVFEFWTRTFLGTSRDRFTPPNIDPAFGCQVLTFRKKLDHPQLLATSRHISGGAVELSDLAWKSNALSGSSELVPGEEYTLYIHEPQGSTFRSINVTGADMIRNTAQGPVRQIVIRSPTAKKCTWSLSYQ
jgi:alpha-galactosidase